MITEHRAGSASARTLARACRSSAFSRLAGAPASLCRSRLASAARACALASAAAACRSSSCAAASRCSARSVTRASSPVCARTQHRHRVAMSSGSRDPQTEAREPGVGADPQRQRHREREREREREKESGGGGGGGKAVAGVVCVAGRALGARGWQAAAPRGLHRLLVPASAAPRAAARRARGCGPRGPWLSAIAAHPQARRRGQRAAMGTASVADHQPTHGPQQQCARASWAGTPGGRSAKQVSQAAILIEAPWSACGGSCQWGRRPRRLNVRTARLGGRECLLLPRLHPCHLRQRRSVGHQGDRRRGGGVRACLCAVEGWKGGQPANHTRPEQHSKHAHLVHGLLPAIGTCGVPCRNR
jgi:hypothetical protein